MASCWRGRPLDAVGEAAVRAAASVSRTLLEAAPSGEIASLIQLGRRPFDRAVPAAWSPTADGTLWRRCGPISTAKGDTAAMQAPRHRAGKRLWASLASCSHRSRHERSRLERKWLLRLP